MTETETKRVLALYGLSKLEDATRANWPWHSQWIARDARRRWHVDRWDDAEHLFFYVPDFHVDDAAAIQLAERVTVWRYHFARNSTTREGHWFVSEIFTDQPAECIGVGSSFGEALLAALTYVRDA